jgi:hypothetical protein
LRLTINDDPDESFQIWGNSCAAGNCGGEGRLAHRLQADGTAAIAGSLNIGSGTTATQNGVHWTSGAYPQGGNLNILNRHSGRWTHFPWVDGNNYIRGNTHVDGTFTVNEGNGDWNWIKVKGNHNDNIYLGSDGTNRGIWADGNRPFSVYQNGTTALAVNTDNSLTAANINFTKNWTSSPDGVTHVSEISNDTNVYKELMIVGNKSAGAERRVGVWDRLNVHGTFCIGNTCISENDLKSMLSEKDTINTMQTQWAQGQAADAAALQSLRSHDEANNMFDGLRFTIYDGYFNDNLDFFKTAKQTQTGLTSDTTNLTTGTNAIITAQANQRHFFSVQWVGYFRVQVSGTYTFWISSDDASYVWIGNSAIGFNPTKENALIDNYGLHGMVEKSGSIELTTGLYPIKIVFGENGGGYDCQFTYRAPDGFKTGKGKGVYFSK